MKDLSDFTAWARADRVQPVPERPGYYPVRMNPALRPHPRSKLFLVGHERRWWDGKQWLAWKDGPSTVFGSHPSHEWRGYTRKAYARALGRDLARELRTHNVLGEKRRA